MLTLYDAPRCPYCARVRIVLGRVYDGTNGEGLKRLWWALRWFGDELRNENATHGPVDGQRGDCYRDMKGGNENPRHAA